MKLLSSCTGENESGEKANKTERKMYFSSRSPFLTVGSGW